jgi:hypothetical protein
LDNSTLKIILDYVWVPVVTGIMMLWSKVAGIDVRAQLLEQAASHYKRQREEEHKLRDEQRREILARIDKHNDLVMSKLDAVETRIKNGH